MLKLAKSGLQRDQNKIKIGLELGLKWIESGLNQDLKVNHIRIKTRRKLDENSERNRPEIGHIWAESDLNLD